MEHQAGHLQERRGAGRAGRQAGRQAGKQAGQGRVIGLQGARGQGGWEQGWECLVRHDRLKGGQGLQAQGRAGGRPRLKGVQGLQAEGRAGGRPRLKGGQGLQAEERAGGRLRLKGGQGGGQG